jgi:ubiquitin C-terminal hydrolase
LIRDIFGGLLKNEFHIEGSKKVSVTYEPFFVLNLEISNSETIDDCLFNFFHEKKINDYKVEGRHVNAF